MTKRAIALLILFVCLPALGAAQCDEPRPGQVGKVIKRIRLSKSSASETGLSIRAMAAGTSWQTKGAEAAVVTVFVDGKYNQDLILFAGSRFFEYKTFLGRLAAGSHELAVYLNEARSAPNARRVTISSIRAFAAASGERSRDEFAVANAPVIYARPNSVDRFSDIPLFAYYEILPGPDGRYRIRYTVIFSGEDGGTEPAALMARWGRLADIEWVYEIEAEGDRILGEIYQGADHVPMPFKGDRIGSHPVIFDVTDNNLFSDKGCSSMRFTLLPVSADLSKRARESVMDENPWTYRIMSEEAYRERRIDAELSGLNTVDDPRRYLYVDVYAENKLTSVAIEAETADRKTSRSDLGDGELRVWRNGFSRAAVRLPPGPPRLAALKLSCHVLPGFTVSGKCQNARIIGFVRLGKNFNPIPKTNTDNTVRSLLPEEKIVWMILEPKVPVYLHTRKHRRSSSR